MYKGAARTARLKATSVENMSESRRDSRGPEDNRDKVTQAGSLSDID